jgi:hypothetical protein
MTVSPVEISQSYAALRETVSDMQSRGRITRLAGIKPVLRRRLPGFDERRDGFRSFGEFCQAAAAQGVIRLVQDDDGWVRAEVDDGGHSPSGETDGFGVGTEPRPAPSDLVSLHALTSQVITRLCVPPSATTTDP